MSTAAPPLRDLGRGDHPPRRAVVLLLRDPNPRAVRPLRAARPGPPAPLTLPDPTTAPDTGTEPPLKGGFGASLAGRVLALAALVAFVVLLG